MSSPSPNRSPNHNANVVIGVCLLAGLATGLVVTSWMGEPTDITTDITTDNAPAESAPNAEGSSVVTTPDGEAYDASLVACAVPAEDSSTADCTFQPTSRYDYVGGIGWVKVPNPDTFRYANGNRPPTGQYLTDHPYPGG
jgi:hypothetical protein